MIRWTVDILFMPMTWRHPLFNLVIGSFMILYGFFTIYLRIAQPEKFGKLGAMKEKFGERGGTILHFVGYTLVPLVCGAFTLYKHFYP